MGVILQSIQRFGMAESVKGIAFFFTWEEFVLGNCH
jgi:hypothetical protein